MTEPVAWVGALEAVLISIVGLLTIIFDWDSTTAGAVVLFVGNLAILLGTLFGRSKVTPYHPEGEYEPESMDGLAEA